MRARVFLQSPEDVQEAARLLMLYFELERPGKPRPIYGASIRLACRLLKVMAEPHSGGLPRWGTPTEARSRLKLAGIDPDNTLRVINQRRWDNAWEQLITTGTFRDDRARRDIATGKKSPRAAARVKAIAVAPKKAEREFNEFLPRELKRRLKK